MFVYLFIYIITVSYEYSLWLNGHECLSVCLLIICLSWILTFWQWISDRFLCSFFSGSTQLICTVLYEYFLGMSGNKNPPAEQWRSEVSVEEWGLGKETGSLWEWVRISYSDTAPSPSTPITNPAGSAHSDRKCVCLYLSAAVAVSDSGGRCSVPASWLCSVGWSAYTVLERSNTPTPAETHTHKRVILNPRVGGYMTRVIYTCVFVPAARAAECIRGAAWALDWWLGDGSRYGHSWAVLPMEACSQWAEGSGAPGIVGRGPCGGPERHPIAAGPDSSDWTGHLNHLVAV